MSRERACAHIGERLGIDDVIAMAGPQQVEEVEAALRGGGAEPGEMRVADLGAEAVPGLVARAGVIHRDPGGARKSGAQHRARLGEVALRARSCPSRRRFLGQFLGRDFFGVS